MVSYFATKNLNREKYAIIIKAECANHIVKQPSIERVPVDYASPHKETPERS